MNPLRWMLVLFLFPIIGAGQVCTNSWPVSLAGVTATSDGKIFAAVTHETGMQTEIWQWSNDLSSRESLWRLPGYFYDLQANRHGSILVCETSVEMAVYDVKRRMKVWHRVPSGTMSGPMTYKSHLVGDDRYLLMLEGNGYSFLSVTVFDLRDGTVIQTTDEVISDLTRIATHQVYFDEDRVTIEYADGKQVGFAWTIDGLRQIVVNPDAVHGSQGKLLQHLPDRKIWTSVRRMSRMEDSISAGKMVAITPRTDEAASTIKIEDNRTSSLLHRDQLGISASARQRLAWTVALLSAGWVILLIGDGSRSRDPRRVVFDIGVVCTFFALVTVAGISDLVPRRLLGHQFTRPMELVGSVLAVWCFLFVLNLRRPLHIWAAILLAACVPILFPVVAAALVLQRFQLRSKLLLFSSETDQPGLDRSKLRFGVAELLMIMAVLGLLMSVGSLTIEIAYLGFGYAVLLVLAIVFSIQRPVAMTLIGLCMFALLAHGCRAPVLRTPLAFGGVSLLMTILTIAMLRVYDYLWFANETRQPVREVAAA